MLFVRVNTIEKRTMMKQCKGRAGGGGGVREVTGGVREVTGGVRDGNKRR